MRLLIISLLISLQATATNYYVSGTGSDASAGTISSPWRTTTKVNTFAFAVGDSIFFKRGDTFIGGIKATKANLNFGAYGTGAKPIITGLTTVTGWVNLGGNIWEAPTTGVKAVNNLVLRNGVIMQIGRFPNPNATEAGYLIYTAATTTSITGPALSTTTNWTGAEVAIRIARWEILRKTVTAHSAGVVSFAAHTSVPKLNYGYFFQRDPRTLDQDGEWYQSSANKLRMYFGNNNPNVYTIQASNVDTLFTNFPGFLNNITVSDLSFIGAGKKAINLYSGSNHKVKNCDISNSGAEAIAIYSSVNVTVDNCNIKNSLGSGIQVSNSGNNILTSVTNCTIDSTALIAGMETSNQNNGGEGITARGGSNVYVLNNRVTNSGFVGISWFGNNAFIKYNFVNVYCKVRDDGAGIYTSEGQTDTTKYLTRFNRNVVRNIVLNGIGQGFGTSSTGNESAVNGIYVDDGTADVLIDSNTVAYIVAHGVHGNDNRRITFTNNTTFQTGFGYSFQKRKDAKTITGMRIVKNIFYPYRFQYRDLARDRPALTTLVSIQNMGRIDSNFYSLRTGTDTSLKTVTTLYNATGYIEQNLPFSYITGTIGDETHSSSVLTGGYLEYNASNAIRTVSFTGLSKKDVFGNVYNNSLTIPAWGSKILINNGSIGTTATTTAVTTSINPTVFGQSTTFTATVNSTLATGNISFKDGATTVGTATISSGVATFSITNLSVGSHNITAVYLGDATYSGSTSNTIVQIVNKAATTTSLSPSINPTTFGQSTTFTATVTPIATGTVTFNSGATVIGTGVLSSGIATFSTSTFNAGTYTITATYPGDGNYLTSTSNTVTQVVNKITPTATLSVSNSPATYTGSALSATVVITSSSIPGSISNILTGGATTQTASGTYAVTASFIPTDGVNYNTVTGISSGSFVISAAPSVTALITNSPQIYSGSAISAAISTNSGGAQSNIRYNGSTTVPINTGTYGVTLDVAANGAYTSGTNVSAGSFTINKANSTVLIAPTATNIVFGQTLASSTLSGGSASVSGTFTFSAILNPPVGTAFQLVTFTPTNVNYNTASTSASVTVTKTSTTTTLVSSVNPSTFGQSTTFTALISIVNPGVATPTGVITFKDGSTTIGTGIINSGIATFTTSLSVTTHSITAIYAGDGNTLTSTSPTLFQVVDKSNTTISVSSSITPVFGQSVTFTALVNSSAAGTIIFKDGTSTIGSSTISSGIASFSLSTLSVGVHNITAVYSGDVNFNSVTSSNLSQNVNKASTSTVVSLSTSTTVFGEPTTFTAIASSVSPGSGTTSGTITFKDGTTTLGTGTINSGVASFSTAALSVGVHSITAVYSSDLNFNASTSSAATQVVNKASTTTSLTSSTNTTTLGQSITFTTNLSVTSPGLGLPTGVVTYKDGVTIIGTSTLSNGIATFSTTLLSIGVHNITAIYESDANFLTSTSNTVVQSVSQVFYTTTTTLITSVNPSVATQLITFTATVSGDAAGGVIQGSIDFYDGITNLGTAIISGGQAIFTTSFFVGTYNITAVYTGLNPFLGSTSNIVSQIVNKANTITSLVSNINPSVFTQRVTFTATLSILSPGSGTVNGVVTFYDSTSIIGTATLTLNKATLVISTLNLTTHVISAVYSGNSNLLGSTSNNITQRIDPLSSNRKVRFWKIIY